MYSQTSPGSIVNMIPAIEGFCQNAGFQTSLTTGTMTYYGVNPGYNDWKNPNYLMIIYGLLAGTQPGTSPAAITKLTLKDPGSSVTHSLIFYTLGDQRRRDVTEPTWYMDTWMNSQKIGMLYNLPGTIEGLDMFAGTTSDGRLWAHIAVEEKPMVYCHFGLGRIEKFMSFTGGDYVTVPFMEEIRNNTSSARVYAYGCFAGAWGYYFCPNGMYAPDLDEANKVDDAHDFRSLMNYVNTNAHVDFEPGHTSLRVSYFNQAISYTAKSGGEISIRNFPLPNTWTGNSPLFPIMVYANNGQNTDYSGACGYYSGVRALNIANYQARDEIAMGPEIWKVYPIVAKEGVLGTNWTTLNEGYAVLKNG
jgi:hypothetical protein